ncbi:MAG: transposase, partial [Gammaproteobacteria bacterium]
MLTSAVSAGPGVASAVDLEFNTREGCTRQSLDR